MKGTIYVPRNALATLEDGRIPTEMMLTLRTSVPAAQVGAAAACIGDGRGKWSPASRR